MSNSQKAQTAEKAKNYSAEQEAAIEAAAPLNLEKAKVLSEELGKSWRSVVAKALSMGLEYEKQEPAPKRPTKSTKADIVEAIEDMLRYKQGLPADFHGLQNATLRSLVNLCQRVATVTGEDEPDWTL